MVGVTIKFLGFLTMESSVKHQASCHQTELTFLSKEGKALLRTSRDHWQSFKLDVTGEWDSIRFVPGKLWDYMQGLGGEMLLRAFCPWLWKVLATLEHPCSLAEVS